MKRLMAALAALLLLCGCEKTTYSYLVLDSDTVSTVESTENTSLSGLIYTKDGDVVSSEDYKLDENVLGVMAQPPESIITDVYHLAKTALDEDLPVMIIYIDGLGWDSYNNALTDGAIPALAGLRAQKCASVYPTITPVNYAAMVTGQTPKYNGVTKRGLRQLNCDTIFDYAAALGKTSYASEGDIQILSLSNTVLELSPDLNGNGTGDDEIFDCAMAAKGQYDLLFVHFHSVDDSSHGYGPGSDQAREALVTIDGWCSQLMEGFQGRVIICADHGQHDNDGTGDAAYADRSGTHGDFAPSDIFTALLTNGGN